MFGWNQNKLARIAELEEQNRELQEIRESLLHEVGRIQGEFMVMRDVVDEYREGSEQQRNIAERLEKERDDLKVQLETRRKHFVYLNNEMVILNRIFQQAFHAHRGGNYIVTGLDAIDERDPK